MHVQPLVDATWLAENLADPRLVVVDCRWYLVPQPLDPQPLGLQPLGLQRSGGPALRTGRVAFEEGHVPGARFADLDLDLAGDAARGPGRHPLPEASAFARFLARLGLRRGGEVTTVVAYDDAGGVIAARLWWLLRHFGLDVGRVLDGGLAAWVEAGGALERGAPRAHDEVRDDDLLELTARDDVVGLDAVARRGPGVVLLDARAPERFRGEVEPIDARPGRIPGALSMPTSRNLERPGGRFLTPDALRALYEPVAPRGSEVVVYCGSGVTACHDLLALELAGLPGAKLYEGSYSEWAKSAEPVARGAP